MFYPDAAIDRIEFDKRRDEVKQRLAEAGFGPQGMGFFGRRTPETGDGTVLVRLRDILQSLGPIFASFGRYLSSRPDLLMLADCVVMAEISDRSDASASEQIRQLIQSELNAESDGISPTQRFVKFNPEPFESRLLFQLHHGELENGDLVVVKVIHPRIRADSDSGHLQLLASAITPRMSDPDQYAAAIDDFRNMLVDALDCRRVAEALDLLSHDTREVGRLTVPRIYRELCTRSILVTQRLDGLRLDRYLANLRDQRKSSPHPIGSTDGIVADELARNLCDVWLRQACEGTMLPVDFQPENILVRSPTEVAILDGTLMSMPRATRGNLLNYLVANATDEPNKALESLLKELDSSNRRITDSMLDRQFRQIVAFRDGGWDDEGRANCLSDTLFAQWRLAAKSGYRSLRHLTHFYRGAFHVALLARRMSPERDSLLEGVKDLRLTKLLNDVSSMMQPSYWGGQVDRLATLMVLGPRNFDEALKRVAAPSETQGERQGTSQSIATSWSLLLSALLALTSFTLFRVQVGTIVSKDWSEHLYGLLFLVIGGFLIRLLAVSNDQKS